jgi:hypothetical protein
MLKTLQNKLLPDAGIILIGLCMAEVFFLLIIPELGYFYFDRTGISWLHDGIFWEISFNCNRYFARILNGLLFQFFGLSISAFACTFFIFHSLNSMLIYFLARKLRAGSLQSCFASVIFLSNPLFLLSMQRTGYLLCFPLLSCFLGICIAYICFRNSESLGKKILWFCTEIVIVFTGFGFKESFVIYPILLFSCELVFMLQKEEKISRIYLRQVIIRIVPHIPLYLFFLHAVPVFQSISYYSGNSTYLVNFELSSVLSNMNDYFASKMLLSGDSSPPAFLGFALVIIMIVLALTMIRKRTEMIFGFIFMMTALLPVLPINGKFEQAYIYQPWAGFAIFASGFLKPSQNLKNRIAGALIILIYLSMNFINAESIENRLAGQEKFSSAIWNLKTDIELRKEEICGKKPAEWNVPEKLWMPVCQLNPGCDPSEIQKKDMDEIFKLMPEFKIMKIICNDPDGKIKLEYRKLVD